MTETQRVVGAASPTPDQDVRPAYRDRYPCEVCGTGYLDCAAGWVHNLKCCAACDRHPARWTATPAYTSDEIRDMRQRAGWKP